MLKHTGALFLSLSLAASPAALYAQTTTSEEAPAVEETETQTETEATTDTSTDTSGASEEQSAEGEETMESEEAPAADAGEGEQMEEGDAEATAEAEAEEPKAVEGQIILQSEDTILANDLIGSSVYSPDGETVGDINDLIVNFNGDVEGVVIGVGGFLGIGEKEVAVEMAAISLLTPEDGEVRLILDATKEDLEAAEEFKTAAAQRAEEQTERLVEEQQNQVNPTVPTEPVE